jgi:hypothetical protein
LHHEVRDDTVEDDIVVVTALCKCRKVLACLRREASVRSTGKLWRGVHTLGAWVL